MHQRLGRLLHHVILQLTVDFDVERLVHNCMSLNKDLKVFCVSAKSGEGMDEWIAYLIDQATP